jgi:hypothetical protein
MRHMAHGEAEDRQKSAVCGFQRPTLNVQRPMSEARLTRVDWSAAAESGGGRFAHAEAHSHYAKDVIAFFQITR